MVGLVLAPHYSALSIGEYLGRAGAAGADGEAAVRRRRRAGPPSRPTSAFLAGAGRRGCWPTLPGRNAQVVFTALPLPVRVVASRRSVPRRAAVDGHRRSAAQLGLGAVGGWCGVAVRRAHARAVARTRRARRDRRAGGQRARLGPASCARAGSSPTTSRCCYDLDIEARGRAEAARAWRSPAPRRSNADPTVFSRPRPTASSPPPMTERHVVVGGGGHHPGWPRRTPSLTACCPTAAASTVLEADDRLGGKIAHVAVRRAAPRSTRAPTRS